MKKYLFSILTFFFLLFFVELCAFLTVKYYKINKELFNIGDFTEILANKKVSLKKNYFKEYPNSNWSIITSSKRTRISKDELNLDKMNDSSRDKILFLGDSVPFGYGVHAVDSLPTIFEKVNNRLISINGAIPSFDIAQSIDRLKSEFRNIINLKYIYFQTYDPASQYAISGKRFIPGDNWTNESKKIIRFYNLVDINIPIYGEPYIYILLKKLIIKKNIDLVGVIYEPDLESDKIYKKYIKDQLNELLIISNKINVKLILAPITINPASSKSKNHLRAVNIFNNILKDFSKKNEIIYFDSISILSDISQNNFIDQCCHLSKEGAKKLAYELNKVID
jgi:hypothetical protein